MAATPAARALKTSDVLELLALAALWGASFLFMRLGAADFGPVAMTWVRMALAALVLAPLAGAAGIGAALRGHAGAIGAVGIVNSVLPFIAYSYAALAVTTGLSAVFNATSPLWAAAIAWWWLGERPSRLRALGLLIGLAGVVALAGGEARFRPDVHGMATGWAVLACLGATLGYGLGANLVKRWLSGVPPVAVAAGSQLLGALVLAPVAWWAWPARAPSALAWAGVVALGVLCTGAAYFLYFRLIARLGPARAISVTFLIPFFGTLWGSVFLGEVVTLTMVAAGGVILLGTALATGVLSFGGRR
jgi:drug/metabolite transporter (DMT)-like permease